MTESLQPAGRIHLYISDHIRQEPFYADLVGLGYQVVPFREDLRGWDEAAGQPGIYLLHEQFLLQDFGGLLDIFLRAPENRPVIILGENLSRDYLQTVFIDRPFYYLVKPVGLKQLSDTLRNCTVDAETSLAMQEMRRQLERAQGEIKDLRAIALALSAERDLSRLLELMLTKSRQIAEADAASLYLIEPGRQLRFRLTQNASLNWQMSQNQLMPIDDKSLAGYVALTGQPLNLLDVYFLPSSYPFTFNRSFDLKSGYRTKSMVVVPIKNPAGEVLGVIQLINKRSDFEKLQPGVPLDEAVIVPFHRNDLDLLQALASQAAIALENARLYEEIKNLFEGFVKASVVAIEARDPTTSGHSERVATLTTAFARTLADLKEGPFAGIQFDEKALTEIRYASLLHDFGKVGVREEVLVKAKKLFPWELENLRARFRYLRKALEADFWHDCYQQLRARGREAFDLMLPALEANYQTQLAELEEILEFLLVANEPTVMEEGNFHRLLDIAGREYVTREGERIPFLIPRETQVLSIRKGSLSEAERTEIESHVTHTFNFLSRIPWTRDLRRVPEIAYAHHEKLNGRGYPNHLTAAQIPLESKLMTISDIFDALTARDRPYKKAIPYDRAFDIMYHEVNQGLLSKELLDIFVQARVYRVIEERPATW
ncbi:MAG: Chemotactic transducer-related protein [Candidatus Ozemobacter sibiricus]|uniref:Chemotactic transducer-related protein n=1 Tax=Candidatus Ozemobacter sibiricus TaxID=2268124 RepID=A0A367ZMT4_9BACT|nr:MAG: Chemotactic transducer-related protein [Candidatus Ozemobacter sibiricus]